MCVAGAWLCCYTYGRVMTQMALIMPFGQLECWQCTGILNPVFDKSAPSVRVSLRSTAGLYSPYELFANASSMYKYFSRLAIRALQIVLMLWSNAVSLRFIWFKDWRGREYCKLFGINFNIMSGFFLTNGPLDRKYSILASVSFGQKQPKPEEVNKTNFRRIIPHFALIFVCFAAKRSAKCTKTQC